MTPDDIKFLTSSRGQKLLSIAQQYDNISKRLGILRREATADQAALVSQQIYLRTKAINKFSLASSMLFDQEGLEQSTAETVAKHISKRFATKQITADLTCGLGGDATSLSSLTQLIAVDNKLTKVMLARHNLQTYQKSAHFLVADSSTWQPRADAYFIDPSRRVNDKRVFTLEDSKPDLNTIQNLVAKCDAVAVKTSPGLNYDYLNLNCEVEVISYNKECREIILWFGSFASCLRRATQLPQNLSLELSAKIEPPDISQPQEFLYEIEKTAIRAHMIEKLANEYGLSLLDKKLSYLTANHKVDSPWLKCYSVDQVMPFSLKSVRQELRKRKVGKLTVKCRSFVHTPDFWKKKFKVPGTNSLTIFLIRIGESPIAILTNYLQSE